MKDLDRLIAHLTKEHGWSNDDWYFWYKDPTASLQSVYRVLTRTHHESHHDIDFDLNHKWSGPIPW